MKKIKNHSKYKADLIKAVRMATLNHVFKTEEKETVHVASDNGELIIWVEGQYKITVQDLFKRKAA